MKQYEPLTDEHSDRYHVPEEQVGRELNPRHVMAGWDKATGMPTRISLDRYNLHSAVPAAGAQPSHTDGLNLPARSTALKYCGGPGELALPGDDRKP